MTKEELYLSILSEELVPALGCTEPIAIAYASAMCRDTLSSDVESVEIGLSGNMIKNVMGVVVPNCGGLKGIEAAVAIGITGGKAEKELEVLTEVGSSQIAAAKALIDKKIIKVSLLDSPAKLHIVIKMKGSGHSALVEIIHQHTNIARIERDEKIIISKKGGRENFNEGLTDRTCLNIEDILSFGESVNIEKIRPIIEPQIEYNTAICEKGLKENWGSKVGQNLLRHHEHDLTTKARAAAAAGSDARMSGCVSPVIINSGSGNQGITVSIPVIEYAKENKISYDKLIRALAISNLIAIHQKTSIGRLSAYCGAVSAACGAGAAITWLSGGTREQVEETISCTLATISGMVCDGAKPSCAAKISVAVEAALLAHDLAMDNTAFQAGEGIVKDDIEKTIAGVGKIASQGMQETDKTILDVMVGEEK